MIRKKANKEIDQMFLGMGVTGSVALSRPNRRAWIIKLVIFLLFALTIAAAVYWFVFRSSIALAKRLPKDSYFYINLSLPQKSNWYSQFLFWKRNSAPSKQASRLYQKLNMLEWEGVGFVKDILPALSGKLEAGMFASGEVVFTAKLIDKNHWFGLFDMQEIYSGQLIEVPAPVTGIASNFSLGQDKWYWFIDGDYLYIANSDLIKEKLGNVSKNDSLASNLKDFKNSLGIIYINNSSVLSTNKYLKLFENQISLPITIFLRQEKDKIVFSNSKIEESRALDNSNTQVIHYNSVSDRSLMLYFDDFGRIFDKIVSLDFKTQTNNLSALANSLYNIDTQDIAQKFASKSATLSVSFSQDITKNNWTLIIQEDSEAQSSVKDILKGIAIQFFAISHPISVEKELKDGSIMVELVAKTNGLEWEKQNWIYNDTEIELDSLQGKGEMSGYYVGSVDGVGAVLSSSLQHLRQTIAKLDKKDQQNKDSLCYASQDTGIGLASSVNFFESDEFINNLINYITINSLDDNKFLGCVFFK